MSDVTEALEAFKAEGSVEEVKRPAKDFPKIPLLSLRDKGAYFSGTITAIRKVVVPGKDSPVVYVTGILEATNSKAVVKTGTKLADNKNEYIETMVRKGDIIEFSSPTRLTRKLDALSLPATVFIESHGKVSKIENQRLVSAFDHTVRQKKDTLAS